MKNCGYLIHLQIGTKEFLNELVRRFPEHPPMHPGPRMTKILEMIHEWRQTLCVTSKHREDLVHIRDMHRLLMYNGYRFPKMDARSAAMLSNDQALQSPEELEEENRLAMSAKLQELIRRGKPRDLQQAQELMKILSGAEPEAHSHTRQVVKELDKVESRVKLLHDMLDQVKPGDKFVSGDAYDQVASNLRSVQPRLQRWVEQASENESDELARFLAVNDVIHQALARYDSLVRGEVSGGAELISFDDVPAAPAEPAAPAARSSELDELDFFSAPDNHQRTNAAGGSSKDVFSGISNASGSSLGTLGGTAATATSSAKAPSAPVDLLGDWDTPVSAPALQPVAQSLLGSTSSSTAQSTPPSAAPSPASQDPFAGLDLLK